MSKLVAVAACVASIVVASVASARPVTTDECLARGLCAYVSPKGRVTCGKCPGQFKGVWFAERKQAMSRRSTAK